MVLPLFGDHRAVQVAGTVVRAWLAQDVPCEVVVAVAGDAPLRLPSEFAGRAWILRADATVTSPGPLRNLGAAATRATHARLPAFRAPASVHRIRPDSQS